MKPKIYKVIEKYGFGTMEDPIHIIFTKEFSSFEDAQEFLDSYRKDKNMDWGNWETPYTYEIKEL